MYSHLVKKLEKKLWGYKNPEMACSKKVSLGIKKGTYFFVLFCLYIKAKWLIKNLHFISNELIK